MKKMYLNFLYQRTLSWVNRRRERMGDTPLEGLPVGIRGDGGACPVRYGLGGDGYSVDSVEFHTPDGGTRFNPWYVTAFVEHFDRGEYPHLSLTRAEFRELAEMTRESIRWNGPADPEIDQHEEREDALALS